MTQGHDMKSLVDLDKVLDCLPKVKGKEHMFRTGGLGQVTSTVDKKSDDGGMDHSGEGSDGEKSADLRRIWEAGLLGIFGGCEW